LKTRFVSAIPGIGVATLGQIGFLAAVFLIWFTEKSAADAALNLALMGILVARVLPAFNAFGNHVTQLAQSAPNVERILASLASLDAAIAAARRLAPVPFPDGWRKLIVCGVAKRFGADSKPALEGVNFAFDRGKVYGLVGRSGAGKTTLANILVGLAEPSEGEVLFDDVRLRDVEIDEWYARIGYVPQASFVLDASVAENVAFGAPIDEARVVSAIAEARLASVVTAMDDAMRGSLGERGGKLSGGQIQRLAIARAIYRRPQFMMFDEATSALDQETEREVQQVLADRSVSRLTIIIAHRVKTLTVCDEILFLEDGRLLGAGPFETLRQTVPAFQAMLNAADAEPTAPGILP
jgi:ABC-type multidrug transport system fused ATPase/permease subunit